MLGLSLVVKHILMRNRRSTTMTLRSSWWASRGSGDLLHRFMHGISRWGLNTGVLTLEMYEPMREVVMSFMGTLLSPVPGRSGVDLQSGCMICPGPDQRKACGTGAGGPHQRSAPQDVCHTRSSSLSCLVSSQSHLYTHVFTSLRYSLGTEAEKGQ